MAAFARAFHLAGDVHGDGELPPGWRRALFKELSNRACRIDPHHLLSLGAVAEAAGYDEVAGAAAGAGLRAGGLSSRGSSSCAPRVCAGTVREATVDPHRRDEERFELDEPDVFELSEQGPLGPDEPDPLDEDPDGLPPEASEELFRRLLDHVMRGGKLYDPRGSAPPEYRRFIAETLEDVARRLGLPGVPRPGGRGRRRADRSDR